jgi:hypothetical protein
VDPPAGFRALVAATRSAFMEGLAHASVPADVLVGRAERTWRSPLFRYLFNYVPYNPGATNALDFTVGGVPAQQVVDLENGSSRFDLEFFIPPLPSAEWIRVRAVFREQVFTRAEVELLLSRYDELIVKVGAALDGPLEGFGWTRPVPSAEAATLRTDPTDRGPDWLVERLVGLWRQQLRRDGLDADANFFRSGGSSLQGALLVQRIKKTIEVPVKLADLFANPTPNTLAAQLRDLLPSLPVESR